MRIYLEEVSTAADMAMALRHNFLRLVANEEDRQRITGWLMLQAALMQYGMVSKFVFPVGRASAVAIARADALRDELQIGDDSPLNNRDARNALEHFDERLDQCLERPDAGVVQMIFEDRAGYDYLNKDRWVVRRAYIVDEDVFIMEGPRGAGATEMPLGGIFAELERLAEFAEDRLTGKFQIF